MASGIDETARQSQDPLLRPSVQISMPGVKKIDLERSGTGILLNRTIGDRILVGTLSEGPVGENELSLSFHGESFLDGFRDHPICPRLRRIFDSPRRTG